MKGPISIPPEGLPFRGFSALHRKKNMLKVSYLVNEKNFFPPYPHVKKKIIYIFFLKKSLRAGEIYKAKKGWR